MLTYADYTFGKSMFIFKTCFINFWYYFTNGALLSWVGMRSDNHTINGISRMSE